MLRITNLFLLQALLLFANNSLAEVAESNLCNENLNKVHSVAEAQAMERKQDNTTDAIDEINLLPTTNLELLAGEYVGTMQSDFENILTGINQGGNKLPLALTIHSLSPLTASINNTNDNFSLYMPEGKLLVKNLELNGQVVSFRVGIETNMPDLSDLPIVRNISFTGNLARIGKAPAINGTYSETIKGFENNQGDALMVDREGTFILYQTREQGGYE